MNFIKKYRKSIFAVATVVIGSSPALNGAAGNLTDALGSVGLDWSSLFSIIASQNYSSLIPLVAIVAIPYIFEKKTDDRAAMREEIRRILMERKKD